MERLLMTQQTENKKPIIKVILNILSNILIGVMGLFIIYMLVTMFTGRKGNEPPTILNHSIYIVRSNSMSPTFKTGTLLIIKRTDSGTINVDDIITFRKKNDTLSTTHRVVEIIDDNNIRQFVTRGDANNVDDPIPVSENDILGKVTFFIPLLGYVFGFIRTKQGIILVIVIPAFILMVTQIIQLFKYKKDSKKESKPETPKEDVNSET
jgi:signal peptidase